MFELFQIDTSQVQTGPLTYGVPVMQSVFRELAILQGCYLISTNNFLHGARSEFFCAHDTDGDGDCHLCYRRPGGCIEWNDRRHGLLAFVLYRDISRNAPILFLQ